MKKRLPQFRNDAEEAAFWDTHDSVDYRSEFIDDLDTVFVRPECGIIELGKGTWSRIVREAKRRRMTPKRLVNGWLKEKLGRAG